MRVEQERFLRIAARKTTENGKVIVAAGAGSRFARNLFNCASCGDGAVAGPPRATNARLSCDSPASPQPAITQRFCGSRSGHSAWQAVQKWIGAVGAKTAYIEPGSPWENGYCESFNARLRDESLNGEIFYTLTEAQIVIEDWQKHYNTRISVARAREHRPIGPETINALTMKPDHSVGADQFPRKLALFRVIGTTSFL